MLTRKDEATGGMYGLNLGWDVWKFEGEKEKNSALQGRAAGEWEIPYDGGSDGMRWNGGRAQ